MSMVAIMGLAIWGFAILFGKVKYNDGTVGRGGLGGLMVRIIAVPILMLFVGGLFMLIGLVGVILASPVLHLFGWSLFSYKL